MKNPLFSPRDFYAFIKERKNTDSKQIAEELKQFHYPPYITNDLLDLIETTKKCLK